MRSRVVFALVVLAVLFPVNAGAIQPAGGSAAAWWVIGAVLFALPSTAVIIALGSEDGSPFASLQGGGHLAHAGALAIWIAGCLAVLSASVAAISYGAYALGMHPSAAVVGLLSLVLAVPCILAGRQGWWGAALIVGAIALLAVVLIAVASAAAHSTAPASAVTEGGWLHLSGGVAWMGLVVLGFVGAHEPYQRGGLRPVPGRAVWGAMAVVVVGYVLLTIALARTLPTGTATSFTSLADLGGLLGSGWSSLTAALVCIAFAAVTLGNGVVFRELQSDLRLPTGSTITLVVATAALCFVALPFALSDSGVDASAGAYAVVQGAAAVLWSLGYVAMGGLAMRTRHSRWIRMAGGFTAVFGLVGTVSVMTGSFTPLLSPPAWSMWVLAVCVVGVGVAWVLKSEAGRD